MTTTNQFLGRRFNEAAVWRGNAALMGGFYFFARASPGQAHHTALAVATHAGAGIGLLHHADTEGGVKGHLAHARDRIYTSDLRKGQSHRARMAERQAHGDTALAALRGEHVAWHDSVRWLKRHGFRTAAVALQQHYGLSDDGSIG